MRFMRLYAYMAENAGDDLMVEILLRRYPKVMFVYDEPENPRGGAAFLKYPNFRNLD